MLCNFFLILLFTLTNQYIKGQGWIEILGFLPVRNLVMYLYLLHSWGISKCIVICTFLHKYTGMCAVCTLRGFLSTRYYTCFLSPTFHSLGFCRLSLHKTPDSGQSSLRLLWILSEKKIRCKKKRRLKNIQVSADFKNKSNIRLDLFYKSRNLRLALQVINP